MAEPETHSRIIDEAEAYWCRLRGGRAMPARHDVDPADIRRLLPFVMIIGVTRVGGVPRFRYRLLGTGIVARSARDYTGMDIEELPFQRSPSRIASLYLDATRGAGPVRRVIPRAGQEDPRFGPIGMVAPLSDDGRTVDGLFGVFDFSPIEVPQPVPVL